MHLLMFLYAALVALGAVVAHLQYERLSEVAQPSLRIRRMKCLSLIMAIVLGEGLLIFMLPLTSGISGLYHGGVVLALNAFYVRFVLLPPPPEDARRPARTRRRHGDRCT